MEPETPDTLRSSVRDLVALSTLPGLWIGRDVASIMTGLVDVAVTMGRLDLAYARFGPDGDEPMIETAAGTHPEPLAPHAAEGPPIRALSLPRRQSTPRVRVFLDFLQQLLHRER